MALHMQGWPIRTIRWSILSLELHNMKQLLRPSLQTFGALQVGDLFGFLFIYKKDFTVS
jgi:hypothetical protein